MIVKQQQRFGTAAEWTAANPVLATGEFGVVTDTGRFKIGNGTDTWESLTFPPGGGGGGGGGDSDLIAARDPESIMVGTITRNGNGAITSAAVSWPDGTTGTYTAGTLSVTFPGATDGYSVTKGAVTYTQPNVTRNADGDITNLPEIVVSP